MSTETKFTKGIWSIRHDLIGVVDHSDTQSYRMMLNICSMDSWDFKDEWESNAQLIAAAPEMYRALEMVCNSVSKTETVHAFDCIRIEKLLAKARGESI
jgi:hypothetical protein